MKYRLLNMETEEILEFPYVMFNNDWNFLQEYLDAIGNPPYKLIGDLNLIHLEIESLGNLVSVGGHLDLFSSTIKSLGNLESVGRYLKLRRTNVESLGNLVSVGGDLDLYKTNIESLGELKSVEGDFNLEKTPLSKTTTEDEIRKQVKVGGNIYF